MKKLLGSILLLFMCLGCANEIHLFPEDVPSKYMVYGLLDISDSLQQVKIRKTFSIEELERNFEQEAKDFIPNPNLQVRVEKIDVRNPDTYVFNSNEYPKNKGFFTQDQNPIHEAVFSLEPETRYKLIIDDPDLPEPLSAELTTINPPVITHPFDGNSLYRFADTLRPFYFQYRATGEVHLSQFYINYIEINEAGDTSYIRSRFDFTPRYKDSVNSVLKYSKTIKLAYLFNILRARVQENEEVVSRALHSFDYSVWAGDQTLKDYLQLAERFPDNRKMFFSNIENGFGFFGATGHTEVQNLYPTQMFFDTLIDCPVTKHLKFQQRRLLGEFDREGQK